MDGRFKSWFRCLTVMAGLALALQASASAAPHDLTFASPDRPAAWFVGGNFLKLDQTLQWDQRSQALISQITYTINGEIPEYENQNQYHTFVVTFPQVKRNGSCLYAITPLGCVIDLATVDPAPFGRRVRLNPNVELSVQRRNGHLEAALVVHAAGP